MARPDGGALRLSLVALFPVAVLAVIGLAVVAAGPERRAVALVAVAAGTVAAVVCGLVLAGSWHRRLDGLADAALSADAALERAARALAEGSPVDAAEEVDPIPAGPPLARVHRSDGDAVALTAATLERLVASATQLLAEEGRRRRAIADLFVNVGRRNQNLVSRQLKLLDRLEEAETDPETLAALFRLDHLSTRMRRNAESLLVVAGLEPPRRWRQPVPVREVARAAASESEEFERVDLGDFPVVALEGDAVATVVHLLAELIDNGVRFSPPDTPVTVSAALDGDFLNLLVADSGVGMAMSAVDETNARLAAGAAEAGDFPAAQLGLYVVGRLATRVGIAVRLDSAGGDGVKATVRIPPRLIQPVPTSIVVASTPEDARRTVAAAERAANGSSARRPAGRPARRMANGAHRAESHPAGAGERPRNGEAAGAAGAGRNGSSSAERTPSGFQRRQPKGTGPDLARRAPSRLRAPDPSSAGQRRDRLDRFSAGKATAEEAMTLRGREDGSENGLEKGLENGLENGSDAGIEDGAG